MEMQSREITVVYVDAENVSARKWRKIRKSLSNISEKLHVRIYMRRNDSRTKRWRTICEQESGYCVKEIAVEGKAKRNKVDKVIISEMLSMKTDVVCIVSSDHGYGNSVEECKRKGSRVYGFGSGKKLARHCNDYYFIT